MADEQKDDVVESNSAPDTTPIDNSEVVPAEVKKSGRGGKRKGAGRKRNNPPTKMRCIYLTDEQARIVRVWGKGDLSGGLRWLINAAARLICRNGNVVTPITPPQQLEPPVQ